MILIIKMIFVDLNPEISTLLKGLSFTVKQLYLLRYQGKLT